MNITKAVLYGRSALVLSESPDIDSQVLLCYVLDRPSSYLHTWPEQDLTEQQQSDYIALIEQRVQGQPVAHLIGQRGFWSLDLKVSKDTLIPRPDTELLVSAALEKVKPNMQIADLGTGTGAIALSLAAEQPSINVMAMDYSAAALQVAKFNADKYQLANVSFWRGDWLAAISDGGFDIIVSNPPYIEQDDPHLSQGDVVFEPKEALVSGPDGLNDIRKIVQQAQRCLKSQGWLLIEHGYHQAAAVSTIFQAENFEQVQCLQDFGGNDRVTIGQLTL